MRGSVLLGMRRVALMWALGAASFALLAPPCVGVTHAAKKKAAPKKGKGKGKKGGDPKREIQKEGELDPKKDYGLDEQLTKTKDLNPVAEDGNRPTLTPEQLAVAEAQSLAESKLDEEIQLARQLLDLTPSCAESAPVRFRYADLKWEKSKRAFFKSQDFSVSAGERARYGTLMKALQNETVQHYQKIIDDCPDYEDFAKTLFYLGRALSEMDRAKDGAQYFTRIIKEYPDSQWVANAWFMVGEFYFNFENDANKALRAYKRAAEFTASNVYGFSVYKQGWCYINTGDWDLALERFREVITISDDPNNPLDQKGRLSLRKEGLKDYVRAYSNVGDPKAAFATFAKVGGKGSVQEMMERLGTWYISQGSHRNVVLVYRDLIKAYPRATRLPIFQGRVVDASSRLGDAKATVAQAKLLTDYFRDVRERAAKGDLTEEEKKTVDKDLREAEDIAENTLRRLAMEFHQEAKKLRGAGRNRSFLIAHDLYSHYLDVFPKPVAGADVNYVFFMRFYFAEVLYELEKFLEAAQNYDMVVDMNPSPTEEREKKIVLAAAEEAVRSYDELVQDLDRKNPPEIGGTDKKEIPGVKQNLINACKRYIKYVGSEGERIVEIRYKMARIYYTYNHFDEAAPAFHDIVANHPAHEVACYSANLALDIYNGQKNYRALKQSSRAYLDSPKLACGEEDKKRFAKIEEQSTFLLIKTEYEDKKNYMTAAKAYMQFYEKFPKSEYADDSVYNAAVNFDLANRLDQANQVRRFLVDKLPDSPLVPETLYSIAQSYERIVDFNNAAQYLELFAQRYPTDKRSKDAIYNAGLYRATLHDFVGSKRDREAFIKQYPSDPDVHTVAFSICEAMEKEAELLEKQNQRGWPKAYEAAHDCYFNYIKKNEYVKRDPDMLCQAQFRRGEIMRVKTKYEKGAEDQEQYILKNWPAWKAKAGLEKLPRCAEAVAQLQFRRLEPALAYYKRMTIAELDPTDRGKKKFDASIKAKVDERDRLIKLYENVAAIGVAEWGLASLYAIGELYRDSVDKLVNAPIPNKIMGEALTAEQKDLLRQQLRDMAAPIEQTAIEAYHLCVSRANDLGVYNKWSVRALERLQKLRPQEYQPLVERLAPLVFEDPLTVVRNGITMPDGDTYKQIELQLEGGAAPGAGDAAPAKPEDGKKEGASSAAPGADHEIVEARR